MLTPGQVFLDERPPLGARFFGVEMFRLMYLKIKALYFRLRWPKLAKGGLAAPDDRHYFPGGGKRVKKYPINPSSLMDILTFGNVVGVQKGIPPGSRFLGFYRERNEVIYWLYIESPLFERVEPGKDPPEGEPIMLKDLRMVFDELAELRDRQP